jgi:GTP cyclohydrolase IA
MKNILELLRLDINDDSLSDTPARIARMFTSEVFSGLDYANFPKTTLLENKIRVDEMVTVSNITLTSM